VRAGVAATLTASVTDDGIPAPQKQRPPRAVEPTLQGAPPSPVNVPLPVRPKMPQGLSVLWQVYRGPAGAAFEPDGYVKVVNGKVEVKATFPHAGSYTLRAFAADGLLRAPFDVIVTVDGSSGSQ
jgi:hypothetical protein